MTKEYFGFKKWYRRRWWTPKDPSTRTESRQRFNDDYAAYLASAYKPRWTAAEIIYLQEEGMECFVEMERRMLKRMQWRAHVNPYKFAGKATFGAFLRALGTSERTLTEETDFIFASVDFEGVEDKAGGVHGYGVAMLDTRDVLTRDGNEDQVKIQAKNFRLAKHSQNFVFGETQRIEQADFRDTIIDSLTMKTNNGSPRKIILVSHYSDAEFRTFRHLNINLRNDLPHVIGCLDTAELVRKQLGYFPRLRTLLTWFGIPCRKDLFHNAGNDAVVTMQALLAWAYRQSRLISNDWPAIDLRCWRGGL